MGNYIPQIITQEINRKSGEIVTAEEWNTLFTLFKSQGNSTANSLAQLYNILNQNYSNTDDIQALINAKIIELGTGDMAKSIYDSNNDGIVNKADTVATHGITTDCIAPESVTEPKLDTALQNKVNKKHACMFVIKYANATSTIDLGTSADTTLNKEHFFNLGFTPKAVLIFNKVRVTTDSGSSYVKERGYFYLIFSYKKFYEYSSKDDEEFIDYGGFAVTGSPAVGLTTNHTVCTIVENGVKINQYRYYHQNSSGDEVLEVVDCSDSYCIAIG